MVKDSQPENIPHSVIDIDATFEVSKLERSRAVKDRQHLNIHLISVTFEVSKRERSREVKDPQPENISLIFVTCEVLRCSNPSILSSKWSSRNHFAVVVGRKSRNEASKTAV